MGGLGANGTKKGNERVTRGGQMIGERREARQVRGSEIRLLAEIHYDDIEKC